MKKLRSIHKWLSLAISLFLALFALSGFVMNHRELFSSFDIPRWILPSVYHYRNWNLAAVKGSVELPSGDRLVYGNIGIWKTDPDFKSFEDFSRGLGNGTDSRKTFTVLRSRDGKLYAGTLFGLYAFDEAGSLWKRIPLPEGEARVVKLIERNGAILVLTRSFLYELDGESLTKLTIPEPLGYDGNVRLFRTFWVVHTGEILGPAGKFVVDMGAIIVLFLILSGLLFTVLAKRAGRLPGEAGKGLLRINRVSIKWHSLTGFYGFIVLLIIVSSGIFLRPPFLIPIASSRVSPIPFTRLADKNIWDDRLRDIVCDTSSDSCILSTSEGFYRFRPGGEKAVPSSTQPPVSIMGITVFEPFPDGWYLVGSFNGLFIWNPSQEAVLDAITGRPAGDMSRTSPSGDLAVTGVVLKGGRLQALIDYNKGWIPLEKGVTSPAMPAGIKNRPMALWNFSQEIHTGRIFSPLVGNLYILYVPLTGLSTIVVLITGLWMRLKKRKSGDSCKYSRIEGRKPGHHATDPGVSEHGNQQEDGQKDD
ncbi:MAG: PepSY domain-containing protein [Candidatus Xenobiia bacterium LiM19]